MNYRREIDGLRALAVVPVILFHAGVQTFSGGFLGVDVFFVISGYLITSIMLTELEAGRFSVVGFYERRARRILPALFLVLAVCVPCACWWLPSSDMKYFSRSLVAVSVFASNLLFWHESGYFDTAAQLKPLLHTWSLAVEEQFYVLFPFFLLFVWRFGKKWIVALLVLTAAASLAASHWGPFSNAAATYFLLPTRAWELGLGALVACYFSMRQPRTHNPALNQGLSAIGLLLILCSMLALHKNTPFLGWYALAPTVGAALIILFAWPETFVGNLLGRNLVVGIGLVSYSAYLWHQPLFSFARHRSLTEPSASVYIALSIVSLALAYLVWRFVEQPFRRTGVIGKKAVFTYAAIGAVAFAGLGIAGNSSNGFEMLWLNEAQRKVMLTVSQSPKSEQCHTSGRDYLKPSHACEYHIKDSDWAVFGNSHAVELAYALAEALQEYQKGLKHFTFSGCPPSFGRIDRDRDGCSAWTQEAVNYIAADDSIKNVVVSYRTHWLLSGKLQHPAPAAAAPSADPGRLKSWTSYVDTVKLFVAAKKNVIVVLQAPQLPKRVQYYIAAEKKDFTSVSGVSRIQWDDSSAFINSRLGDLPSAAIVIDPEDLFCDRLTCAAVRNGTALYFDDQHMSVAGAAVVAAEIVRRTLGPPPGKENPMKP